MLKAAHKEYMVEISKIDELVGKEPRYPYALTQSIIENALNKQNEVIRNSNSELRESILNSTSDVCGTLENGFQLMVETNERGFETLNESLIDINSSINDLANINKRGFESIVKSLAIIDSTLNWGFSKIIELNKQRNIYLNDIIALLNIPDIEKVRKLNIEKGLDYFKKSIIDTSFLADSKRHFEEALKKEENDYFVLYNLGLIHLFSKQYLDFSIAKKYFLKAAKYSNADIMFSSVKYTSHKSSFRNPINPTTIATYSYLYGARCEYMLENYNDALSLALKSYKLSPNIVEVAFDTSKYLAINKNLKEASNVLSKAIDIDRFVTLKVLKDTDLIKHSEIKLLEVSR